MPSAATHMEICIKLCLPGAQFYACMDMKMKYEKASVVVALLKSWAVWTIKKGGLSSYYSSTSTGKSIYAFYDINYEWNFFMLLLLRWLLSRKSIICIYCTYKISRCAKKVPNDNPPILIYRKVRRREHTGTLRAIQLHNYRLCGLHTRISIFMTFLMKFSSTRSILHLLYRNDSGLSKANLLNNQKVR